MILVWWVFGGGAAFAAIGIFERLAKTRPWLGKLGERIYTGMWVILLTALAVFGLSRCTFDSQGSYYLGCERNGDCN